MPLHREYRPTSLDGIIGNRNTVRTLDAHLKKKSKFHAFLLCGPRGCGKTTIGRIIADRLGCEVRGLTEINAANNRGIETAREIVSNIGFFPISGLVRVFLLDEAHMGTKEFWNALLKVLEEPPEHIYFILCTTEPEKIPNTVRSRCAIFPVALQSQKALIRFLNEVAEKADLPTRNIEVIAKLAEGCPREALILLEQYADTKPERIKKREEQIIELCRAIWQGENKWLDVADILKGIKDEPERTRIAVMRYCNTILLSEDNSRAALIMDYFKDPLYNSGQAGLTLMAYQAWSETNAS